jgi:DNA helicase-2/ATP-dependent DNA helicase PcrA
MKFHATIHFPINEAETFTKDGPMIDCYCGAGSGKNTCTDFRVLVHQGDDVQYFILRLPIKAAREMKKRISDIVGSSEAKIYGWELFSLAEY